MVEIYFIISAVSNQFQCCFIVGLHTVYNPSIFLYVSCDKPAAVCHQLYLYRSSYHNAAQAFFSSEFRAKV